MPTNTKGPVPVQDGYSVHITTVHGAYLSFYEEDAAAVMRSLEQRITVDAVGNMNGIEDRYIIPFYAIDSAVISYTQPEHTTPVDDNCKNGDEPATGDFVIRNHRNDDVNSELWVSGNHAGTFGDVTFMYDEENDESYTDMFPIPSGGSVTISGLPVGTQIFMSGTDDPLIGTVPGSYDIGDAPGPGPGPGPT